MHSWLINRCVTFTMGNIIDCRFDFTLNHLCMHTSVRKKSIKRFCDPVIIKASQWHNGIVRIGSFHRMDFVRFWELESSLVPLYWLLNILRFSWGVDSLLMQLEVSIPFPDILRKYFQKLISCFPVACSTKFFIVWSLFYIYCT